MGTNARMAEWEAGILDVQMDRLPSQMALRTENARRLYQMLKDRPYLALPPVDARITTHAYHLFTYNLKPEVAGMDRRAWIQALRAEGIPAAAGYVPLYHDPMLKSRNFMRMTAPPEAAYGPLPVVEEASQNAVLLEQYLLLGTQRDLEDIVTAMDKVANFK